MTDKNHFSNSDIDQRLQARLKGIKHIIAVMSNKGGVGKSTVSVNIAMSFACQGFSVGLLDADLHGPSILKLLGLEGERLFHIEGQIFPLNGGHNVQVVSMAGLIESPDTPLIWRGPLKIGVIKQLLADVEWDRLDYLIVDLPPGTGDEPLTIAQLIPDIDGTVIVTTPQDVAILDARKAISFARQVEIPVIGIVENMSGMVCPHCKEKITPFKQGGGKSIALEMNVPFLGTIPFDPAVVELADNGKPIIGSDISEFVKKQFDIITDNILSYLSAHKKNVTQMNQSAQGDTNMKIAVPTTEGRLSMHFGHCESFVIYEIENQTIKGTKTVAPPPHEPGVLPQFLAQQGVNCILAGGMGQRAQSLFNEKNIKVITGVIGDDPKTAVQEYLSGSLQTGNNCCDH